MKLKARFALALVLFGLSALAFYAFGRSIWVPVVQRFVGKKTVEERLAQYGPKTDEKLQPLFQSATGKYPPASLTLIGLKEERRLEVWAPGTSGKPVRVLSYPVLAASGKAGPKLRAGDRQVPEGFYPIEGLNPNSAYHLSLKVGYPNAFDAQIAAAENRHDLGGNIFIHGKAVSIGCLAIGDEAIEELFVLVARVGRDNVRLILAPHDFRVRAPGPTGTKWLDDLYGRLSAELAKYRL